MAPADIDGLTARTRRLTAPWPFKHSVLPGRGLVLNIAPRPRKPARLAPVRPACDWEQGALLPAEEGA